MRHRVGNKHLGLPTDQRIAVIKSLVLGVLQHGHVTTTEARAKEARSIIEQVITLSREDTVCNRRLARRWIPIGKVVTTRKQFENVTKEVYGESQSPSYRGSDDDKAGRAERLKKAGKRGFTLKGSERRPSGELLIKKLFEEIGPKYRDRPGGYLRLTKLGGISHENAKGQLTVRPARRGDSASMVKIELVD